MERGARARGQRVSYADQLQSDESDESDGDVQVVGETAAKRRKRRHDADSGSEYGGGGDDDGDAGVGLDLDMSDEDDEDDDEMLVAVKSSAKKRKSTDAKSSAAKPTAAKPTAGPGKKARAKPQAAAKKASPQKRKLKDATAFGSLDAAAGNAKKPKIAAKKTAAKRSGAGGVKTFETKADQEAASVQQMAVQDAERLAMMSKERAVVDQSEGLSLPRAVAACDNREFKVSQNIRKHHRLFVLPGQMSLQSVGMCGTIEGFASTKPVLNIEFAGQGKTLRLHGSLVHPESNYLCVNFDEREKQGVTLDAKYEEVVVFTTYEWVSVPGATSGEPAVPARGPVEDINWNDPDFLGHSYMTRALASVPTQEEETATRGSASPTAASQSARSAVKRAAENWNSDESDSDEDEVVIDDDDEGIKAPIAPATPRRAASKRSAAQSARKAFKQDNEDDDDAEESDEIGRDDESAGNGAAASAKKRNGRSSKAKAKVVEVISDDEGDDEGDDPINDGEDPMDDDDDEEYTGDD